MDTVKSITRAVEDVADQVTNTNVRVGMIRWAQMFRAGGEEMNERVYVSAARALDPLNYPQYPGNTTGVRLAVTLALTMLTAFEEQS